MEDSSRDTISIEKAEKILRNLTMETYRLNAHLIYMYDHLPTHRTRLCETRFRLNSMNTEFEMATALMTEQKQRLFAKLNERLLDHGIGLLPPNQMLIPRAIMPSENEFQARSEASSPGGVTISEVPTVKTTSTNKESGVQQENITNENNLENAAREKKKRKVKEESLRPIKKICVDETSSNKKKIRPILLEKKADGFSIKRKMNKEVVSKFKRCNPDETLMYPKLILSRVDVNALQKRDTVKEVIESVVAGGNVTTETTEKKVDECSTDTSKLEKNFENIKVTATEQNDQSTSKTVVVIPNVKNFPRRCYVDPWASWSATGEEMFRGPAERSVEQCEPGLIVFEWKNRGGNPYSYDRVADATVTLPSGKSFIHNFGIITNFCRTTVLSLDFILEHRVRVTWWPSTGTGFMRLYGEDVEVEILVGGPPRPVDRNFSFNPIQFAKNHKDMFQL